MRYKVIRKGDDLEHLLNRRLDWSGASSRMKLVYDHLNKPDKFDVGVVAMERDRLIGFLCGYCDKKVFVSYGTWVNEAYRKSGFGKKLWKRMIKEIEPANVKVTVISDLGMTLVESLRRTHPRINFLVVENGNRKLRVLKKKVG